MDRAERLHIVVGTQGVVPGIRPRYAVPPRKVARAPFVARGHRDNLASGEIPDRFGELVGDTPGADDPPAQRRRGRRIGDGGLAGGGRHLAHSDTSDAGSAMTVRTGVGSMTVRLTVHNFSCDRLTTRGTKAAAAAPASVSGNEIRKVSSTSER